MRVKVLNESGKVKGTDFEVDLTEWNAGRKIISYTSDKHKVRIDFSFTSGGKSMKADFFYTLSMGSSKFLTVQSNAPNVSMTDTEALVSTLDEIVIKVNDVLKSVKPGVDRLLSQLSYTVLFADPDSLIDPIKNVITEKLMKAVRS